ncbi:retrovirus-related pol polyprotein from transposon TNT 1-94, partial [Tanacetum coccineum]
FVDPENPNHVYKLKKALYGLKQAPRVSYDLLSKFLLSQKFSKGTVNPILFIRREGKDILLIQIYVDDIIFASTKPNLCESFSKIMCLKFKISIMGKLSFFLGLQISQSPRGIFLNQSKYALESLKKPNGYSNGLWNSKDSCIALTAFADADNAGCQDTRKSTSGSMQLLGDRLTKRKSNGGKLFKYPLLVPSCFVIFNLEPLSLYFDFVFTSEIFKSLSFILDHLCHLVILCLDQNAHTLHHFESLLTISLDRLDILKEDLIYQSHEHMVINLTLAGMRHLHLHLYMNPEIKQLAIKRVDEYGFVIRPDLVGLTFGSVRTNL